MKALATISFTAAVLLTSTATFGSSLAVNPTAALGGSSFGLEVTVDNGGDAYVQSDHPDQETTYTMRFRIRVPNDFSIPMGQYIRILRTNDTLGQNLILFLGRDAANQYRMAAWANDDGGTWRNCGPGIFLDFPGAPVDREIELTYSSSTAPGANNGTVTLTKIGTAQVSTRSNLDTDTRVINRTRVGVFDAAAIGATGTYHFDTFSSFR